MFPPDEDAFFDKVVPESWFEIPPVATPSWLDPPPDRVMGQTERVRLKSQVLGNERPLTIYRSADFGAAGQPEDILVLFDRWVYAHVLPTLPMIDRLVADRAIPPIFIAMVGHPDDDARGKELSCCAPFADFLARELMPWLADQYHLSPHPTRTVIGGMSAGGLAAAHAELRYPELFGNVFSQSGAYSWKPESDVEYEWLTRQFVASPRLPLNWYLSVGVLETRRQEDGAKPTLLLANRHLRDILHAKEYAIHYTEYSGGHNFVW